MTNSVPTDHDVPELTCIPDLGFHPEPFKIAVHFRETASVV
jgi:hypothetical protein